MPYLNFAPLQNAVAQLQAQRARFRPRRARCADDPPSGRPPSIARSCTSSSRCCLRRTAAPPVVPPPDLRPRLLHRLRREDDSRRARGDRAEEVERSDAQMEIVANVINAYAAEVDRATDAAKGKTE